MQTDEQTHTPDVLIVEDNEFDMELFQRAMRKNEHQNRIFEAAHGVAALAVLNGEVGLKPEQDCIMVLDINLPKMDGLTLLEKIREHPQWAKAPCFMLTSSDYRDDVLRARDLGVQGYILKDNIEAALADSNNKLHTYLSGSPDNGNDGFRNQS